MPRRTRLRALLLAWVAFLIVASPAAWGVRAALDFTFRVNDGGDVQEITCDFCGYRFSDGSGRIVTLSVNAARGYVEVFFLDSGASDSSKWGRPVQPQEPAESSASHFEVGYFRKARVREGQSLKLRGRAIEFTLVDAFGRGCPAGMQC
jgi:hypothetical protein